MKVPGRVLLVLILLVGLAPLTAVVASTVAPRSFHGPVITQRRFTVNPACGSDYLASPMTQESGTVDYFVQQNVVTATSTVYIHLGAYASVRTGLPSIQDSKVLDSRYRTLTDPRDAGSWHVDDSCGHVTGPGQKSDLYYFEGTWTAPLNPGSYELAVTFRFGDLSVVSYLVNMQVVAQDAAPLHVRTYAHDAVVLSGLGVQNMVNHAYDLDTLPGQIHVMSTDYFEGDPAPRSGASKMASGLLNGVVDNQNIFANVDQAAGSHGLGHDGRISLPCVSCGQAPTSAFTYRQATGGEAQTGYVSVGPPAQPVPVGTTGRSYTHEVVVDEPVTVCHAPSSAPCAGAASFYLKVGAYVVDNGFSGPVNDGYGSYAENFGDGQGFVFYANPGRPALDPTHQRCDGDARRTCIFWDPVNPGAIGRDTGVVYRLTLVDYNVPRGVAPQELTATTTTPWASFSADQIGQMSVTTYTASVQASFLIDNGRGNTLTIESDNENDNLTTGAQAPLPSPVTATSPPTSAPTSRPTPPAVTPTPTSLPATATPTPARAAAALVQTVVPYAWVRSYHGDDAAAQDRLYASTWQHNPDPATFSWPVGRPLHLLPAVDEDPTQTHLAIDDLGNGGRAVLYPQSVTATDYTVLDAGALGSTRCQPSGHDVGPFTYMHVPRSPHEIDPFSPRIALVWAPPDLAGTLPSSTVRCDVTSLMSARWRGPAILSYRIHERLTFAAQFAAAPPRVGGVDTCAAQLVSVPVAGPGSVEPGVPAPAPAFASMQAPAGPCPAGDVGLAAARQALDHWRTEVRLADPNGVITGLTYAVSGTLVQITMVVERTVTVQYHLLVSREVLP